MKEINPEEEHEKGRIALWLEPSDIAFICDEWRRIPKNLSEQDREIWARIAFRGMTALNKNGIQYDPNFPAENRIYKMENNE